MEDDNKDPFSEFGGQAVATDNKDPFSEFGGNALKKYTESTSTTQNGSGASVQKVGFSDSQKSSLGKFKLDSEDLQNVSIGNKPKTLDVPKEADLTMRKVQLENRLQLNRKTEKTSSKILNTLLQKRNFTM